MCSSDLANYIVKSQNRPPRRHNVRNGRRDRQIRHRGVLKLILGMAVSEAANLAWLTAQLSTKWASDGEFFVRLRKSLCG